MCRCAERRHLIAVAAAAVARGDVRGAVAPVRRIGETLRADAAGGLRAAALAAAKARLRKW